MRLLAAIFVALLCTAAWTVILSRIKAPWAKWLLLPVPIVGALALHEHLLVLVVVNLVALAAAGWLRR
jgi:hypothetical protein